MTLSTRYKWKTARESECSLRPSLINYAFVVCMVWIGMSSHLGLGQTSQTEPEGWNQWRGPGGTGASQTAQPPTRWSENENVKWKTKIDGLGHSSPVIWKDTVFLTTAIPFGPAFDPIYDNAPGSHDNKAVTQKFRFAMIAVDRVSGKIKWQKTLHEAVPHEGSHVSGSLASGSPVVDADHVFAYFGSYGIYCLDHDGNRVWSKSFGRMDTKHAHGEGASPALDDDLLVINWDHEGSSFIVALEKSTGNEIWRRDRQEVTSWSSPIIHRFNDRRQVIVAGTGAVRGYDASTGKTIWECSGLSHNIVATPIAKGAKVYVGSSYEIKSMMAINLDGAAGDITGTDKVIWKRASRTPYVPTPLLYRNRLYFLRHYQGILTVADASNGDENIGPFRLPGIRDIYASPVAADGRIYITSREGVTLVLSEKEMPRLLAVNRLSDAFNASPAMVGNQLLLRGENFLYCLCND